MAQSSAQRKFAWGVKHVNALGTDVRLYQFANAYEPRVERKVRSTQEVEYKVLAIERKAPNPDWPTLAGDAIQNLRSALDHAVYALTPKKNRGKSQFPIFHEACEFKVKGRPLIAGVPKPIRALIEAAQPCNRWPQNPYLDPLAILSRLSNLDKHRDLVTVASAVAIQYVGVQDPRTVIQAVDPFREGRPLHDNAEVDHFIARRDLGLDPMDVNPRFTYEVRIEGRPLLDTLRVVTNRVFECLIECETGKPISPFQQGYPIAPF